MKDLWGTLRRVTSAQSIPAPESADRSVRRVLHLPLLPFADSHEFAAVLTDQQLDFQFSHELFKLLKKGGKGRPTRAYKEPGKEYREVEKHLNDVKHIVSQLSSSDPPPELQADQTKIFTLESEPIFLRQFFLAYDTKLRPTVVREYIPFFEEHLAVMRECIEKKFAWLAVAHERQMFGAEEAIFAVIDRLQSMAVTSRTLGVELQGILKNLQKMRAVQVKNDRRRMLGVVQAHLKGIKEKKSKLLFPLSEKHGLSTIQLYQTLFYAAEYCNHKLTKNFRLKVLESLYERLVDRLKLVRHKVNRSTFFELRKASDEGTVTAELKARICEIVALQLLNPKLEAKFGSKVSALREMLAEDANMFSNVLKEATGRHALPLSPELLEKIKVAYESELKTQQLVFDSKN